MKKELQVAAVLVAASTCVGLGVTSGDKVFASKADPIQCAVMANDDEDEYVLKDFPSQIVFGQADPVTDLYLNNILVDRSDYKLGYYDPETDQIYGSYVSITHAGTVNYGIWIHSVFKILGTVKIVPCDINDIDINVNDTNFLDLKWDTPAVEFSKDGNALHFTGLRIEYGNAENPKNQSIGTGYITIDAKDCDLLSGTKTVTYNINKAKASDLIIIGDLSSNVYNGSPNKYTNAIISNRKTGEIYTPTEDEITYKNNQNAGTATVTINSENIDGKIEKNFEIERFDFSSDAAFVATGSPVYIGSKVDPEGYLEVNLNGKKVKLTKDVDYKLRSYEYAINAGTATVVAEGIGNYTGSLKFDYDIERRSIKEAKVTIPYYTEFDTEDSLLDKTVVKYGNRKLIKDIDYQIICTDSEIKIKGIGNYKDSVTESYSIQPIDLSRIGSASVGFMDGYRFTYMEKKPSITLYFYDLKRNCHEIEVTPDNDDFEMEITDNLYPGNCKVKIVPKSDRYKGSFDTTIHIDRVPASMLTFSIPEFYEGEITYPTVTYLGHQLEVNKDFDIDIDNTGMGKVEAKFTFKGNFTGEKTLNYEICGRIQNVAVSSVIMDETSAVVRFAHFGYDLVENKDYKITMFTVNDSKTKININIQGIGNFKGIRSYCLDMTEFSNKIGDFSDLKIPDQYYKCEQPVPYFDDNGKKITIDNLKKENYSPKVTYLDKVSDKTGRLSLELDLGDHKLTMIKNYNIKPASLKEAEISEIASVSYTGKAQTPSFDVTFRGKKLTKDVDYTVEYKNNVNEGTAKIIIKGIGNCVDSTETTFVITRGITPTSTHSSTATPAPTSASAAKPTPTVTPAPTAGSSNPASDVAEFVNRIYVYVLDREPEAEGAAFWSDELWNFRRTGAEVAQGFIFSPEFENRHTSDQQFVTILYKTFFGREPEEDGMNFWLAQLSTGAMDRITVANGFIYSQEWADTCASYGIRSGGDLKPTGNIAPTDLTYAFVERMYTTALGRGYDEAGKQYWASELANFNVTGESVGASFFLSDEMTGYNLSNEEFLGRLYATFMDREPDADGKTYWLGVMESGASRSDVVFGFTRSPEFINKCVDARILPY